VLKLPGDSKLTQLGLTLHTHREHQCSAFPPAGKLHATMPAPLCSLARPDAATSFTESKCKADTCGRLPDSSNRALLPLPLLPLLLLLAAAVCSEELLWAGGGDMRRSQARTPSRPPAATTLPRTAAQLMPLAPSRLSSPCVTAEPAGGTRVSSTWEGIYARTRSRDERSHVTHICISPAAGQLQSHTLGHAAFT
jgi:hypothetical protein